MKNLILFLSIAFIFSSCKDYIIRQRVVHFGEDAIETDIVKNRGDGDYEKVYDRDILATDSISKHIELQKAEDFVEKSRKFDKQ